MPPFLYPPLATALLSYSDLLLDHGGTHSIALSDATEARSTLRNALKEVAIGATEWLPVVDVSLSMRMPMPRSCPAPAARRCKRIYRICIA